MNTNSGAIYDLSSLGIEETSYQEQLGKLYTELDALVDKPDLIEDPDVGAAVLAHQRGDPIVPVSERVAHTQMLGTRERERRDRRRKAQRQARKRNRP